MKITHLLIGSFMLIWASSNTSIIFSQSCPTGLVAYWKMDESSGTSLSETIAGYTATRNSPAGNVSGKVGNSQRFTYTVNGSNNAYTYSEYAFVPHNAAFNFPANSSFTFTYWCRYTDYRLGFQDHLMISKGAWGGGGSFPDGMIASGNNGSGKISFMLRDNTGKKLDIESKTGFGNGAWHHVACVRDNATKRNILYVDGIQRADTFYNYTGNFSTTMDLQIGTLIDGGTRKYFYKGDIDEVGIFNRALSLSEITDIMNSAVGICAAEDQSPAINSVPVTIASIGEPYTYTIHASGTPSTMTYSLITKPSGMTINASTGLISWTPGTAGSYPVEVSASNGVNPNATQLFTITVSGTNPVITSVPVTIADVGVLYNYTVHATGTQSGMTYSLTTAPAGMAINATSGLISWTPSTTGDFQVEVEASNGILPSGSQSFTISVSGSNPDIISIPVTEAFIGSTYHYTVHATGTQPGMTYSLITAPGGMTINAASGLISWNPGTIGDYAVQVKADNGIDPFATQSFTISVSVPVNCPDDIISLHRFDESAGPVYADFYAEHNATASVSPAATAGIIDGAQLFGALTKVDIPDVGTEYDWLSSRSFSIECWVKTSTTAAMVFVGRNRLDYVAARWLVGTNSSGRAIFELRDNGGPNFVITGTSVIADDQWHHIVAVRDGEANLNKLYVDGAEEASVSKSYIYSFKADNPLVVTVGYLKVNTGDNEMHFNGSLDELAIYNRAIASVEVTSFYNEGNPTGHCRGGDRPPYFTSNPVTTVNEDSYYNYTATVNDSDVSDVLTMSATVKPVWLHFNWTSGQKSATLTGTPINSDVGEKDVVVRVSDGEMSRNQIYRITVNNVNDAPVKTSTPVASVNEGATYSYTLTVSDVDVSDVITMSVVTLPSWLNFTWANGAKTATITGIPQNDNVGANPIDISITDGHVTIHESYTLTVNQSNAAPVITGQNALAMFEDQDITLLKSDLNITDNDNPLSEITISVLAGSGYTFNGNTVTPFADFNGVLHVNVKARDQSEDSQVFSVAITVNPVNDPPVIVDQNLLSVDEDQSLTISPSDLSITDVDNATGDLTIVVQGGSQYSYSGNTVTPESNFNGPLQVNVRAYDLSEYSQTYSVVVTVNPVNDAPVITSTPELNASVGNWYGYLLTAADIDGDVLTKSAVSIPGWLSFSSEDSLSGSPVTDNIGENTVTLRVTDGIAIIEQIFTITVTGEPITAVPDILKGEFLVYPQPANEVLHIKFNGLSEKTTVEFISPAGTVISSENVPAFTEIAHFNLQDLEAGTYFCHIKNSSMDRISKFLIVR